MKSVTYTVGDLNRIIAEGSNEFKAKLGDGVESANKTESGKAYKDAEKRAKDYDGGGNEKYWGSDGDYKKEDYNGTTLDYNPENVTDEYKKRVHAQAKGFTSEDEMNNGLEKSGDFSHNEKIYQGIKKAGQEKHDKVETLKKTGLQASKMPDGTFKKEEMYESIDGVNMRDMINSLKEHTLNTKRMLNEMSEVYVEICEEYGIDPESELGQFILSGGDGMSPDELRQFIEEKQMDGEELNSVDTDELEEPMFEHIKTVFFKKTKFLDEEYMRNRIPDEFKKEGCKFRMKDKVNNNYLLEWRGGKANILEHNNKAGMQESMARMKQLMGYTSDVNKTNVNMRLNEGQNIEKSLNRVRDLMK